MSLLDNVDKKVKSWLFDCFDVVDAGAHYNDMAEAAMAIKSMQKKYDETVEAYKGIIDTVNKIRCVTVSIPATWAPWYEDEKFSRLLWDNIKSDCIMTREDRKRKYASVAVVPKEVYDELVIKDKLYD